MAIPTIRLSALAIAVVAIPLTISFADELNQEEAQAKAAETFKASADESLKSSFVSGMSALTELGRANVLSAVNHGRKAYSSYNRAESLDVSEYQAKFARSRLSGGGRDSLLEPFKPHAKFSRVGKDFLFKGEAAIAAAAFEKVTGMKRESLFQRISAATDNPVPLDDPKLVTKSVDRLRRIVDDMPDAKAKKNAQGTLGKVPDAVFNAMAVTAIQWTKGLLGTTTTAAVEGKAVAVAPEASVLPAKDQSNPIKEPSIGAVLLTTPHPDAKGGAQPKTSPNSLLGVVGDAILQERNIRKDENMSLFERVKAYYRKWTGAAKP